MGRFRPFDTYTETEILATIVVGFLLYALISWIVIPAKTQSSLRDAQTVLQQEAY